MEGGGVGGGGGVPAGGAAGAVGAANPAAAALAMLQNMPDAAGDQVAALEQRQRDLRRQKQQVQNDLKLQKRRQSRLMEKAKNLSDEQTKKRFRFPTT